MTNAPQISIVLPTYNGSRYLDQAIQSVIAQTLNAWELIIVDDASTDASVTIAEAWAARDARIRLIRHSTNQKLPAALNTGFAAAAAPFLTWTSDDNYYRPQALESMLTALTQHPRAEIVYASYTTRDEDTGHESVRAVRPIEELVQLNVVGACFLYRRVVHKRLGGYDTALFRIEDYDFWLRASVEFRFVPLAEDLYVYRYHGASLTGHDTGAIPRLAEQVLLRHLPRMTWLPRFARCLAFQRLALLADQRGESSAARRWLLRALGAAPLQAPLRLPAWQSVYALLGAAAGRALRERRTARVKARAGSAPP